MIRRPALAAASRGAAVPAAASAAFALAGLLAGAALGQGAPQIAQSCTPPPFKAVCAQTVPWETRWRFSKRDFSGACFYSNGAELVAIAPALMKDRVAELERIARAACAAGLRAPDAGHDPNDRHRGEVAFFPFDPGSPNGVFGLVHNRWNRSDNSTIERQSFFLAVDTRAGNAEGAIGKATLAHEYMHLVQARYAAFPRAIESTGRPVAEWIREGTAEAVGQSWDSANTLTGSTLRPAGAGQFPHGRFALPLVLRKLPTGQDRYSLANGQSYADPQNPPFTYLTWPFWEFVALRLSANGYGYLETLYAEDLGTGSGAEGADAALRKIRGAKGGGLVETWLDFLSYVTRRGTLYPNLGELHDREDYFDCERPGLTAEPGSQRRWTLSPGGGTLQVMPLAARCYVIEIPASPRAMVMNVTRGLGSSDGESFSNPKVHLVIEGAAEAGDSVMRIYPPDSAGRPREAFVLVTAGDPGEPGDQTPQTARLTFTVTELPEKCAVEDIETLRGPDLAPAQRRRLEARCGAGWGQPGN